MITNDNEVTYLVKNVQKHDNVIYERPLRRYSSKGGIAGSSPGADTEF